MKSQFEHLFIDLSIQCHFFISIINSIFNQKVNIISNLEILNIRVVSISKSFIFFENIVKTYLFFLTDRSYFLIWTIISISISKIVRIFINVWYCNHFFFSKIFRYFFYLSSKSTFVFCFDVEFNIRFSTFCIENHYIKNIKNFLKRFLSAFDIHIIFLVWKHLKITSVCLTNRYWFSIFEMTLMFQHMSIFYSEFIFENSNVKFFNEVENFLQHFQQCQNQYSKSNMFEWLSTCLKKFVFEWFNDQSKFIFLHEFDIVLTNAFLFKQNNNSFFSIFASKSTYETFENSTNFTLIVSIASSKK